jgi:hypothetical protein
MDTTIKGKPTYEELEKEVRRLKFNESMTQTGLARYLKTTSQATLEMILGTKLPLKIETYFGHPNETLKFDHPNIKHMEGVFTKTIKVD